MMEYLFDQVHDLSNMHSQSYDGYAQFLFSKQTEVSTADSKDYIHMWIADMEIATPEVVLQAIHARLARKILGYTTSSDDAFYHAVSAWTQAHHNWTFPAEQLCLSDGVGNALSRLVSYMCAPDEKIVILTPAYAKFRAVAKQLERTLICSDLRKDDGQYRIDFVDLEQKLSDETVKLFISCNPHNPIGQCWNQSELEQIVALCKKYDVAIISDEIHCDLLRHGKKHLPLAKIASDYDKIVTCMSVAKTFNMTGIALASIIIPNAEYRVKWHREVAAHINPLSFEGSLAAYQHGADWLEALRTHLDENFAFAQAYLQENLPKAHFRIPDGTYLGWVDLSAYFTEPVLLSKFFAQNGKLLLQGGDANFVHNAENHVRINFACPRVTLAEGLRRLCVAVKSQ